MLRGAPAACRKAAAGAAGRGRNPPLRSRGRYHLPVHAAMSAGFLSVRGAHVGPPYMAAARRETANGCRTSETVAV